MPTNILLSGVGGQGIITASKVLSEAALISGCHMKKSEVHGMSQRGGSVESHIRFSREAAVYSPLIPAGDVDVLLAFEALEALRALPMTRPEALLFVDDRQIAPMSVVGGQFEYPSSPVDQLAAGAQSVHIVGSFEIALGLGEQRAANIVMLGAASRFLDIDDAAWPEAIERCVRPKAVDVNLSAFAAGVAALADA